MCRTNISSSTHTAHRLGAGEWFPWKDEDELNEWLVEDCAFTIEDLKNNPSGYHYAEHQFQKYKANAAAGKKPFNTPTGKMEFACQYLKDLGYQELPEYFPPALECEPQRRISVHAGDRRAQGDVLPRGATTTCRAGQRHAGPPRSR